MRIKVSRVARGWRSLGRLSRTTAFRLTTLLGLLFAAAIVLLLGLIYLQTASYLTRRVDGALAREVTVFTRAGPKLFQARLRQETARDPLNSFGLFNASGVQLTGDTRVKPADLSGFGASRSVGVPRMPARALKAVLPWGDVLVVERDTRQLVELRRIILEALVWSGASILVLGFLCGVALSLQPLQRIAIFREAMEAIAAGDMGRRLPVNGRGDELDELARLVNAAMDELERLVTQARTVGEGVAHELRTPLTRLRATLDHAARTLDDPHRGLLERCVTEAEVVLHRFNALLRIAAVEARSRQANMEPTSLTAVIELAAELYHPVAAEQRLTLQVSADPGITVRGDPDLLLEAVLNLLDNAMKFTPAGGTVQLHLQRSPEGTKVLVRDDGPGIAPDERPLVTKRFYRAPDQATAVEGHGLGLSLVAAVAALHGLELRIEDACPGAAISLVSDS